MTEIKEFYSNYADKIVKKRFDSESPLRKYVHNAQYQSILNYVEPGMKVLDIGCGEGVMSVLMAKKGAKVTGCDLSKPNIEACIAYAKRNYVKVEFVIGDAEVVPFGDNSFDLVVSSHVLEHLPDFDRGLQEIMRVTKKRAVIAIPTICNPCSLVQVGRGAFWCCGKRDLVALPWGFLKMVLAYITGKDGVNEKYAGNNVPHVFRFPRVLKEKLKKYGYTLVEYEASSVCLPHFNFFLGLTKKLDCYKKKPVLRNFGYGTTFIIQK
ncbi:MAG: class I SAM-dependent methyltransferase [Candidatus Pacebacteria bacterium]|nr:class I SAM-dependent methyltransferase [Candidatus Paceibacterota bacterium]